MSTSRALRHMDALLRSDKTKERSEGYSALKDAFKSDSFLGKFDEGDGVEWLYIFQSLFVAIHKEKAAYLKKGYPNTSTANYTRLKDAAGLMRWLVERSCNVLRRKVLKPLIDHLFQTSIFRGEPFEAVILDYTKALRTLLSNQRHLDHLDVKRWKYILHFAFGVLLGDRLVVEGTFVDEDEETSENDQMEIDELDEKSTIETPKKRRREDTEPPSPRKPHTSSHTAPTISPRKEHIEVAAIIRLLLSSSSTPYIFSDSTEMVQNILRRFKRFYTSYPLESSAHYDILVAMNSVVSNLTLNTMREVSLLGHEIWGALSGSWLSRDRFIREGLVIAFSRILPYVTHASENITTSTERGIAYENIQRLCRKIIEEVDGMRAGGFEMLSLEQLRLQISSTETSAGVFQTKSLRSGNVFSEGQALTWATLELHSDCVAKVCEFLLFDDHQPN